MYKTICIILAIFFFESTSYAGEDHSEFIETSLKTPGDVTRACLECHDTQGEDFIKTAHWLWKGETPFLKNHESDTSLGKINLMNNY